MRVEIILLIAVKSSHYSYWFIFLQHTRNTNVVTYGGGEISLP